MLCLRLFFPWLLLFANLLHAQGLPVAQPLASDDMSARVQACVACHGREGRATNQGYFPRIAGKPQGYLYNQLQNFRDGRRSYAPMAGLLDHLSDAYMQEIAGYFSQIEVPYPTPQTRDAPAAILARGQALVQHGDAARKLPACVQCHGAAMTGVQPFVPGLLGLPRDYLNAQLGAWQTGQRKAQAPDCMAHVAAQLTPAEVSAVSTWLSAQLVPQGGKPVERLSQPWPMPCGGLTH